MKILKLIEKIFIGIIGGLIGLVLIVLTGLNLAKFAIYSEYYSIKDNLCNNPGLNDGFVHQGIALVDGTDKVLVCGYMMDSESNSRIYVTDSNNDSYYVNLIRNDNTFTGHAGGIAVTENTVYLANGSKIYTFSLTEVLNAKNGDFVEIGSGTKVNNNASFVFTNDTHLYVGEFHDGGKYVTDHPYNSAEGMHYAIVTKYNLDDLTTPIKVYSIRDKVQGIAFTNDGKVVMSTSYGLTSSVYYIYDEKDAVNSGEIFDEVEVFLLDKVVKKFEGPAMGEDLDVTADGKIVTLTESASNKYIFGKFFFANKIVTLDINKLLEE